VAPSPHAYATDLKIQNAPRRQAENGSFQAMLPLREEDKVGEDGMLRPVDLR
jgi:hypothetical protein